MESAGINNPGAREYSKLILTGHHLIGPFNPVRHLTNSKLHEATAPGPPAALTSSEGFE